MSWNTLERDFERLSEEEKVSIITELLDLYERKGGLTAEDVVEFARNENTALHKHFTWDDAQAAQLWRLQQARRIINVSIQFSGDDSAPKTFRPLVGLIKDNTIPGGGYRSSLEVYNAGEQQRRLLVKQAISEAQRWRMRYGNLPELAPVYEALEQVQVPAVGESVVRAA